MKWGGGGGGESAMMKKCYKVLDLTGGGCLRNMSMEKLITSGLIILTEI